jgi:hypothetical protein
MFGILNTEIKIATVTRLIGSSFDDRHLVSGDD